MNTTIHIDIGQPYKGVAGEITGASYARKEEKAATSASDAMVRIMVKNLTAMRKKTPALWTPRWQGILAAYEHEAAKRKL